MYVRCIAAVLLGLCACNEAAQVRAAEVKTEAPPNPWVVTVEEGSPPRLRYSEVPGLELPVRIGGVTTEWREPVVVVSRAGIGFAGDAVLGLEDGRIPAGEVKGAVVPRLGEAFGSLKGTALMLLADRRLRFGDVVLVMSSALRAGTSWWSFAVRRPEDAVGTVTGEQRVYAMRWDDPVRHTESTREALSLAERSFVLALMITADTLEIGEIRHTGAIDRLARFKREEGYEPVQVFARTLAEKLEPTDRMPTVVFGVDPEVPLERVIAALVSVRGPGPCEWPVSGRGTCWFPEPYLDRHARSLWDLAVPDPGALTVTLAETRGRDPFVTKISVSGDSCVVEREPGLVAARWWSNNTPVRLVVHDDGRQRLLVNTMGELIEVDPAACARFSAEVTRHDVAATDGVALRGFLDVDCALGEVVRFGEKYRARVSGRVNFSPCV